MDQDITLLEEDKIEDNKCEEYLANKQVDINYQIDNIQDNEKTLNYDLKCNF